MTPEEAAVLIKTLSGDAPGVYLTFSLIRRLGSLDTAAFVSQAVWLSSNATRDENGWFFLEQVGDGAAKKNGLYQEIGSWESAFGIGKKRQDAIRCDLIARGLLCELPSVSGQKKGSSAIGNAETAFLFLQRRGTPPRLHYRVDLVKYLKFLSQPIDSKQKGKEVPFESGDKNPLKVPKEGFESDDKDPLKVPEKDIQKPQIDPHVYNEENDNDHHNKTTTTNPPIPPVVTAERAGGGDDIDSLVEAALWQQEKILPPKNPAGWRFSVRRRMSESGVSDDDRDTLARYRKHLDAISANEQSLAQVVKFDVLSQVGSAEALAAGNSFLALHLKPKAVA